MKHIQRNEFKELYNNDIHVFLLPSLKEKHKVVLNKDDCVHLNNCLILLQNILHLPKETDLVGKTASSFQTWQNLQNKLIW